VALGLLAHHRKGIRHTDLRARIERFDGFLQHVNAERSTALEQFDQASALALDRFHRHHFIRPHEDAEHRIWEVAPEKRITLDFYKNQVLHFFAIAGYTACAIRSINNETFSLEDIKPGFIYLLWTLRREFQFDPNQAASQLLAQGLDQLVTYGALKQVDDRYQVADTTRIGEIYGLFRSILESYHLVLRQSEHLLPASLNARDYARKLQSEAEQLLAVGIISRPESLSLIGLTNAVTSFIDEGVFLRDDGLLSENPERRAASIRLLAPMVS
jgi:glycerol-3-phosphate O-acyltransferase